MPETGNPGGLQRRGACHAPRRALACALLVIAALMPAPVRAEPPTLRQPPAPARPGTLRVESPVGAAGSVFLYWTGSIAPPMAEQMSRAFDAFKSTRTRVVLVMNSGGGTVAEGEKVIALLQRIRRTHRLDTVVQRGATCGSMCLPVYLQGMTRYGARTSSWLFHEITRGGPIVEQRKRVAGRYDQLIELYWIPAGVSRDWIRRMLPLVDGHDYWQTGEELISSRSGIIHEPIENRTPRNVAAEQLVAPKQPAHSGVGTGGPAPLPAHDPHADPIRLPQE